MTARAQKILATIDLSTARGIEIGPLASPIVTREMADVRYADRASREELVRWYRANADVVDVNRIVDVDYVWGDRTLPECVGADGPFDFCIASHVAEHVPDLVTWLHEVGAILKDDGVLSLVLPDMRYMFDCLRAPTTLSDLVGAYIENRRRPSPRQIFDHFSLNVDVSAASLWAGEVHPGDLQPRGATRALLQICQDAASNGTYIDSHCWVGTPRSFLELLRGLSALELIEFEVASFFTTDPGQLEFFVALRKLPASLARHEKQHRLDVSVARAIELIDCAEHAARGGCREEEEGARRMNETEIGRLQSELAMMRSSRSWRVTAPLRAAARVLTRLLSREK